MINILCDLCGAPIVPRDDMVSKIGIMAVPGGQSFIRQPLDPNEQLRRLMGGELHTPPGVEKAEFEACYECVMALLVELKRRRLEIKNNGRVELE